MYLPADRQQQLGPKRRGSSYPYHSHRGIIGAVPTYGFILETAEDRLSERGEEDREPRTYSCPFCSQEFARPGELRTHEGSRHPLEAPRLLIDGVSEIGPIQVFRSVSLKEIQLANVSSMSACVDGGTPGSAEISDICRMLSGPANRVVDLTLWNERALDGASSEVSVRIVVDIPDPDELSLIDDLFESMFSDSEDLNEISLAQFAAKVRPVKTAKKYANACYEYCVAVQIKDLAPGTGESQNFAVFQDKMQEALEVLARFPDRGLARAIAGSIRFSLNDFSSRETTGIPELDACTRHLQSLSGRNEIPQSDTGIPQGGKVPVDTTTQYILDRWGKPDAKDELERKAAEHTVSSQDALKCRALALSQSVSTGTPSRHLARTLVNDSTFGAWANQVLDTIDDDA